MPCHVFLCVYAMHTVHTVHVLLNFDSFSASCLTVHSIVVYWCVCLCVCIVKDGVVSGSHTLPITFVSPDCHHFIRRDLKPRDKCYTASPTTRMSNIYLTRARKNISHKSLAGALQARVICAVQCRLIYPLTAF